MAGIDITNGTTSLTFDADAGGRVAQVTFEGRPLLVDREGTNDALFGWGCYPMVPWAGRLGRGRFQFRRDVVTMPINFGDHAMHGLGLSHPWSIVASSASSLVARLDLGALGWPFPSWCEQRVSLGPDSVHLEMSVHGEVREFPAQVGWHPWFRRPERIECGFDAMFVRDATGLTTNARVVPSPPPWDDCFTEVREEPSLVVDGVRVQLSSTCRYWVLYTEPSHAVCIEPQSGPPNAFNLFGESELDIVGPGRTLQHSFVWRLSR